LLLSAVLLRRVAARRPAPVARRACCVRAVQQSIDIACQRVAQQQTRRTLAQRSTDGTDRQTDRPMDILAHTMRAVSVTDTEAIHCYGANVNAESAKEFKQVAAIMLATGRITQLDPLYLPGLPI